MAKCPKCDKEILLESGGWNWIFSVQAPGPRLYSPFQQMIFTCSKCGLDSLSIRLIDMVVFRIIDLLPYFILMGGLIGSIPWLSLKTVWLVLVLFPLIFITLWGFVLHGGISNFWWKNIVRLKTVDDPESARDLGYIFDIVVCLLLFAAGFKGLMFIVNHLNL